PASSLYWQEAEGDLRYPIGLAGEWLQNLRPPAQWSGSRAGSDGSTVYKLKGGRALALLPLDDGTGNGLVLEVRPERATMEWWSLERGQPAVDLDSTSYRPSGVVSAGDLASETALIMWVGSLLGV